MSTLLQTLPSDALRAVEAAATVAFALSGLLAAARKRLDAVGVCVVAGLAAFGGGTLRDLLLQRRPFSWVEQSYWLWLLLATFALRAAASSGREPISPSSSAVPTPRSPPACRAPRPDWPPAHPW